MKQDMKATNSFVHQPAGPGLMRICPKCAGWWVLEFVRSEDDEQHGELRHYRCKKCDSEVVFSSTHDSWNLYGQAKGPVEED